MASDLLRVFAIGSPVIYQPFGQRDQFAAKVIAMTLLNVDLTEHIQYSVHLKHSNTVSSAHPYELAATDDTTYSRIMTP